MAKPSLYHEVAAQYKATLDGDIIDFFTPHEGFVTKPYLDTCRASVPLDPLLLVKIKK
jgi:hypothetical protein